MESINEDTLTNIFDYLCYESKLNMIMASHAWARIFANSSSLLKKFMFLINSLNIFTYMLDPILSQIPFKNFSIAFDQQLKHNDVDMFLKMYKGSAERIELKNMKIRTCDEFFGVFHGMENLQSIYFDHCNIDKLNDEILPNMTNLTTLSFDKCNANIFKVFRGQKLLRELIVKNDEYTWNGFSHEDFNTIAKNSTALESVVLLGAGTVSYFDCDDFPFKIRKLETTSITFHWYVGIKSKRVNFLESQKGYLQHLTIHQLPTDFDGGKVLKYIIEEMELDTFYLGKTPLILAGKKQSVLEFEATEINITSVYEMFYQFPMIEFFRLVLSKTDIASDEIERIINPHSKLFDNLQGFELVDDSSYFGIFGVFLGFFKNLRNIQKLMLRTQDRNINVILEECLPEMRNLEELLLTSEAPRINDRFNIIRRTDSNLKKLIIHKDYVEIARNFFPASVTISAI